MSTKTLRNFALSCIRHYSKYDDDQYCLDVSDLPDFVQHEFAALIMSSDSACASEATGPDNKLWQSKMLPALITYLNNSTCQDEAIEFRDTWRDCVTHYMTNRMQEFINDELAQYNKEESFSKSYRGSMYAHY